MQRTVISPYTFKDGLHIPAGFSINFPSMQHSLDAELYGPDVNSFDPKRWINKRQGFDTSKYQFASSSDYWLNWGNGPHACPGRFLADITIKLIIIHILTNFDIKNPEGVTERQSTQRNLIITPDMANPILFKEIKA